MTLAVHHGVRGYTKDWIARGSVILTSPSRGHVAPSRWISGHLFNVKWLNFSYQFLNIRLVLFVSNILYGTTNYS